jgi:hypothetical protein
MGNVRRSGRISKQIPVLLLGTDGLGHVFSEETTTLVLSLHGAGVLSRCKLVPDEILTMRLVGSSREAEVRLVGQMGQQGGANVYGIAFTNPALDFWEMEFPPPSNPHLTPGAFNLECSICGNCQSVLQSDIEADVYAVNDSILRYCEKCSVSTPWRSAKPGAVPSASVAPAMPAPAPHSPYASEAIPSAADWAPGDVAVHQVHQEEAAFDARSQTALAVLDHPVHQALPSPAEVRPAVGGRNRRKDVRARVTFTACVRSASHGDELVECDNVSRGGLCFRSRKQYEKESLIEIAAPYSPGESAIFSFASIKRVEDLPAARLFRYGVAYVKSLKPAKPAYTF